MKPNGVVELAPMKIRVLTMNRVRMPNSTQVKDSFFTKWNTVWYSNWPPVFVGGPFSLWAPLFFVGSYSWCFVLLSKSCLRDEIGEGHLTKIKTMVLKCILSHFKPF